MTDQILLIILCAVMTLACRSAGFLAAKYMAHPRLQAGLRAAPIAAMTSVVALAAMKGGPPEWAGLVAAFAGMRLIGNAFAAAFIGVAVTAALRVGLG